MNPVVIGLGTNAASAVVGGLVTRYFSRGTAKRDRLLAVYNEWGQACHEFLTHANSIGVAIANEVKRQQQADYHTEAIFYVNRAPGSSYYAQHVEFHRRLQAAQFNVASSGDRYRDCQFLHIVADISREALKINVLEAPPKIGRAFQALLLFTVHALPERFDTPWWKKAGRAFTWPVMRLRTLFIRKESRENPATQLPAA